MLPSKAKNEFRILCIGDSMTIVSNYPLYLEKKLNENVAGIRFEVINKGVAEVDTSAYFAKNINDYLSKFKPDMVIAMVGYSDMQKYQEKERGREGVFFLRMKKALGQLKIYSLFTNITRRASNDWRSFFSKKCSSFLRLPHHQTFLKEKLLSFTRQDGDGKQEKKSANVILPLSQSLKERKVKGVDGFTHEPAQIDNAINGGELMFDKKEDHIAIGWNYFHEGKYDKAMLIFEEILKKFPEEAQAYMGIGGIYWKTKRYQDAENIYRKA